MVEVGFNFGNATAFTSCNALESASAVHAWPFAKKEEVEQEEEATHCENQREKDQGSQLQKEGTDFVGPTTKLFQKPGQEKNAEAHLLPS